MEENGFVVEVDGLVKRYREVAAVDGLSFRVKKGEFYGLLGPNGAGKTTTIRTLYGYVPPTAGKVTVFGIDVTADRRAVAARTGVCPQDNNLDPDLSTLQNLVVYARYYDIPRREAERRAAELLHFIALDGRGSEKVTKLSGGMQRRLILARALINEPELLILDEPTTGLDPQSRHQLWDRLRALRARGLTMILTTHYMDEAERLCDRLLIMDRGKLLVEGAPSELILRHVGRQVVEITEPDGAVRDYVRQHGLVHDDLAHRLIVYSGEAEAAFRAIVEKVCTGCMLRQATLEDVFLRLTGRDLRE